MATWIPSTLRFVVFTHPGTALTDAATLWQQVFGSPPQTFQATPPLPGGPPVGGSLAQGNSAAGQVQIQVQVGRVDIVFPPFDGHPEELPKLPSFDACLAEGLRAVSRLSLAALRIGVNIEAQQKHDTPENANAALAADIPLLKEAPKDALDLTFALNRRVQMEDIEINRLLRWSVGSAQFFQFQMAPGTGSAMPFSVTEINFVQLLVDFNTVPLPHALPLPGSRLPGLWAALAHEANLALSDGYDYLVR